MHEAVPFVLSTESGVLSADIRLPQLHRTADITNVS